MSSQLPPPLAVASVLPGFIALGCFSLMIPVSFPHHPCHDKVISCRYGVPRSASLSTLLAVMRRRGLRTEPCPTRGVWRSHPQSWLWSPQVHNPLPSSLHREGHPQRTHHPLACSRCFKIDPSRPAHSDTSIWGIFFFILNWHSAPSPLPFPPIRESAGLLWSMAF